jgi:aspartate kinase
VVIWKDVAGVLNGDPKIFDDVSLLEQISYREAIELAYYGASVIHPKTIQPLQEKQIQLRVKSFMNPKNGGTLISKGADLKPNLPCFIKKDKQVLITIATRDLAFIVEDHLSHIYKIFHQFGVRVNMSQNTAVSSSFCINYDPLSTPRLIEELSKDFETSFNENVRLYTVRNYDEAAIKRVKQNGAMLLEQISRNTYQVVVV